MQNSYNFKFTLFRRSIKYDVFPGFKSKNVTINFWVKPAGDFRIC